MAIDPKELRIGSHINVKGVRVVVDEITNTTLVAYVTPDNDWEATDPAEDWIEPIPITEELLTEFGFCKKIIGSDWSMLTKDVDSFSISVGIQNHVCKGVEIRDNDDKDAMFGWTSPCKYLHELESFYYHCVKQELITD